MILPPIRFTFIIQSFRVTIHSAMPPLYRLPFSCRHVTEIESSSNVTPSPPSSASISRQTALLSFFSFIDFLPNEITIAGLITIDYWLYHCRRPTSTMRRDRACRRHYCHCRHAASPFSLYISRLSRHDWHDFTTINLIIEHIRFSTTTSHAANRRCCRRVAWMIIFFSETLLLFGDFKRGIEKVKQRGMRGSWQSRLSSLHRSRDRGGSTDELSFLRCFWWWWWGDREKDKRQSWTECEEWTCQWLMMMIFLMIIIVYIYVVITCSMSFTITMTIMPRHVFIFTIIDLPDDASCCRGMYEWILPAAEW